MTDTYASYSRSSEPATPPQRRRGWDVALSIVLMLAGAVVLVVILLPSIGIAVGIAEVACEPASCNQTQLSAGMALTFVLPLLATLIASVVAVIFLVRRKLAFWVVAVGIAIAVILWVVSLSLVFSSGPFTGMPDLLELTFGSFWAGFGSSSNP
jgi:hypothetical protein